jgi:hypothetical protein
VEAFICKYYQLAELLIMCLPPPTPYLASQPSWPVLIQPCTLPVFATSACCPVPFLYLQAWSQFLHGCAACHRGTWASVWLGVANWACQWQSSSTPQGSPALVALSFKPHCFPNTSYSNPAKQRAAQTYQSLTKLLPLFSFSHIV